MTQHLNFVKCPGCGQEVHDQSPACPNCHTKIEVEDIGDIPFDRHRALGSQKQEESHEEQTVLRAERSEEARREFPTS